VRGPGGGRLDHRVSNFGAVKSTDRLIAVPPQIGFMRAEYCCTFLRPMLPPELYLEVRKHVFLWEVASCPEEEARSERLTAAVNARWKKAG
jgi:hypothetical protein